MNSFPPSTLNPTLNKSAMESPLKQLPMESGLAVTRWIAHLRDGNGVAAARLWKFLEPRLLRLGRKRLRSTPKTYYDEDDLAQSAFHALCSAIQNGRYEDLADREEVWKLISTIALNKLRKRVVSEATKRRGGEMQRNDFDSALNSQSDELCPRQKLLMEEECERLLELLRRDEIKQVALLRVEGYTNEEIANALNCTRRTVQRRLDFIRNVWSRELDES